MTHSGYLKLYQLSRPTLPGDIILLDEAQDTNPVMQALVLDQLTKGKAVLMCGDPYQQIYAWRGAVDAMKQCEGDTLYLTQSFRFGEHVAMVANKILTTFFGPIPPLTGLDEPGYVGRDFRPEHGSFTTITRTNSEIFRRVAHLALHDNRFHVIGKEAFYQMLDQLQDVFWLYAGKRTNVIDRRVSRHNTFTDLRQFAEDTLDVELLSRCNIVENYRDQIPEILNKVRGCYSSIPMPELPVYVTCHKAKGLEWPSVKLADDFEDLYDDVTAKLRVIGPEPGLASDEVNLYYVAATRAKKHLCVNHQLSRLLNFPSICDESSGAT